MCVLPPSTTLTYTLFTYTTPLRSTFCGHKGKSSAMYHIWANRTQRFSDYLAAPDKIQYCRSIPWSGDITCYHLAKNFGAQVAKPDVHLVRVADRHATNAQDLCERISAASEIGRAHV